MRRRGAVDCGHRSRTAAAGHAGSAAEDSFAVPAGANGERGGPTKSAGARQPDRRLQLCYAPHPAAHRSKFGGRSGVRPCGRCRSPSYCSVGRGCDCCRTCTRLALPFPFPSLSLPSPFLPPPPPPSTGPRRPIACGLGSASNLSRPGGGVWQRVARASLDGGRVPALWGGFGALAAPVLLGERERWPPVRAP